MLLKTELKIKRATSTPYSIIDNGGPTVTISRRKDGRYVSSKFMRYTLVAAGLLKNGRS